MKSSGRNPTEPGTILRSIMGNSVPLESAIVQRIMRYLNVRPGVWAVKIHGDGYTRRGVPDIIGSAYGRAFALEVKRPGVGVLSESQKHELQKLANAGALVAVVESLEDALKVLGIEQ